MEQVSPRITVRTVGLRSYQQAQLKAQLSRYPNIELAHFDDWSFGLLHVDVLIVGVDMRGGQETLDMLRAFSAEKEPLVVTYSENDERVHSFLERKTSVGEGVKGRRPGSFYQRLQQALRNAGAANLVLEDVTQPPVETPSVEGKAAESGVRWTG